MICKMLWGCAVSFALSLSSLGQGIEFSRPPGFYPSAFALGLFCKVCDSIRFTTDGSDPARKGLRYRAPLDISVSDSLKGVLYEVPTTVIPNMESIGEYHSWKPAEHCYHANVIRAIGYENNEIVDAVSGTWFIGRTPPGIPVVSVLTDSLNLFDRDTGIYIPGTSVVEGNSVWTGNYQKSGKDWERRVVLEFYDIDGHRRFGQMAGMRMHGMKVVAAPQKSLRFYARKRYGTKWFHGLLLGGQERQKRFVLRCSYSAWHDNIIADLVAARVAKDAGLPYMDGFPVLLFIDGEYWGLHTLRERVDKYYFSQHCKAPKKSVFYTEAPQTLKDGDQLLFSGLADLANDTLLPPDVLFDSICSIMDMRQFADYFVVETFLRNTDWPFNNVTVWRLREDTALYRFVVLDMDACFSNPADNMFQHIRTGKNKKAWIIRLVSHMMEGKRFPELLNKRYEHLSGGALSIGNLLGIIDSLANLYEPYVGENISRWQYPDDLSSWLSAVEKMKAFARHRHQYYDEQMRSFVNGEDRPKASGHTYIAGYITVAILLLIGVYFYRRKKKTNQENA